MGQGSVSCEGKDSTQIEEAVKCSRNQLVEEATDIFLSRGGQLPEKESDPPASPRHPSRVETDTEKELKKLEKPLKEEKSREQAQEKINKMAGADSFTVSEMFLKKVLQVHSMTGLRRNRKALC